jgi:hypothetical protein
MSLYVDEQGRRITTHSMLKTYLRCPKQSQYKYAERLKQKRITARQLPLKRGTWFHRLLELYYRGEDWRAEHAVMVSRFAELMDEEKDALGDLPAEIMQMMRSYLWHYGANKADPFHGWEVIDTELTFDCPWPDSEDGMDIYRCRLDLLAEDQFGLFIGDHKTHRTLPDHSERLRDAASALYLWAAKENGYDVNRFIWNYVRTKAPTIPQLVDLNKKTGPRLSSRSIETDYPTMVRAIKGYGIDHRPYAEQLRALKAQRWEEGGVQNSSFFRRNTLEKDDDMLARVVASAMKTRDRMHADFDDFEVTERVPDRSCQFMCDYRELCEVELFSGDASRLRRQNFRSGDPLDYYQEQKDPNSD